MAFLNFVLPAEFVKFAVLPQTFGLPSQKALASKLLPFGAHQRHSQHCCQPSSGMPEILARWHVGATGCRASSSPTGPPYRSVRQGTGRHGQHLTCFFSQQATAMQRLGVDHGCLHPSHQSHMAGLVAQSCSRTWLQEAGRPDVGSWLCGNRQHTRQPSRHLSFCAPGSRSEHTSVTGWLPHQFREGTSRQTCPLWSVLCGRAGPSARRSVRPRELFSNGAFFRLPI